MTWLRIKNQHREERPEYQADQNVHDASHLTVFRLCRADKRTHPESRQIVQALLEQCQSWMVACSKQVLNAATQIAGETHEAAALARSGFEGCGEECEAVCLQS